MGLANFGERGRAKFAIFGVPILWIFQSSGSRIPVFDSSRYSR
jgi:hypothetical protein